MTPDTALKTSVKYWFICALMGQWAFVLYMILHYGGSVLRGDLTAWQETAVVGYAPGDRFGNVNFAIHILVAAVLTTSGGVQLIPALRNRYRGLHRWNGRFFVFASVIIAIGGLFLIWDRGAVSAVSTGVSVSVNAVLMLWFAVLAMQRARARDFGNHRRWALRAFIAMNGVWFFRVGTTLWVLMNGGTEVGLGANFDGPFVFIWHWGALIVPLFLLELYLRVPNSTARYKTALARVIALATVGMALGSVTALIFLWWPFFWA
jgi:hypothetical protein